MPSFPIVILLFTPMSLDSDFSLFQRKIKVHMHVIQTHGWPEESLAQHVCAQTNRAVVLSRLGHRVLRTLQSLCPVSLWPEALSIPVTAVSSPGVKACLL